MPRAPRAEHIGDVGDIGSLFFTSGTTGASKAVATTWHYLFTTAATAASAWEFSSGEVLWTAMPLFHLSAAPSVLAPMLVGGTTVLAPAFHPGTVWDEVRACGAVGFAGAGAMVSMLLRQPPDPRDAQLPLRFISAAPIDASVYRDIEKRYGCRIVTMYGMTEAFPIAVKSVADEGVPGTSGTPNPSFDVRIVDPDGEPLPDGSVGEIACRPRYPHVMSEGYVNVGWCRPAPGVVSHRRPRCAGQRPEPDLRGPGEGFAAPPRRERFVGRSRDCGDGPSGGARSCGGRRAERPR